MNEVTPMRYAYGWFWKNSFWVKNPICKDDSLAKNNLLTWNNTRQGVDLPNWRVRIAQGYSATTEFRGFRSFVNMTGSGYARVDWPFRNEPCYRQYEEIKGDITGVPGHGTIQADVNSALSKSRGTVIRKAKDLLTPFQGAVALGELGQTLRMLRSPGRSLFKLTDDYLTRLKKAERRLSAKDRRAALSDAYLEYTYGWRPLAHDVDGALKALQQYQEKRPFTIVRVVGRGKAHHLNPPYVTSGVQQGLLYVRCIEEDFVEESFITRAGIRVAASGSSASIPSSLGFLPENWAPTAWELLPYSFVADYFANIGNIIDAWSLVNGNLAWCNETRRTTRLSRRRGLDLDASRYNGGGIPTSVTFKACSASRISIWVHRYVLESVIPPLVFRLPSFGSTQSLNLAALLHQKNVRRPFY